MQRITNAQLHCLVAYLNKLTNSPAEYMGADRRTNVDHYCLSFAYGGAELQRVCNESGGVRDVLHTGHTTKRDLFNQIHSFIRGIESQQGA